MAKIKLKSKLNKSANSNWEIVDDLPKAQWGKEEAVTDSVKHQAIRSLQYEKGDPNNPNTGGGFDRNTKKAYGMSDWGYHESQSVPANPIFKSPTSLKEATDMWMQEVDPRTSPYFDKALTRSQANDFLFSTGRDIRPYIVDQLYKEKYGKPEGLPNRSKYNKDTKKPEYTPELQAEINSIWDANKPAWDKLSYDQQQAMMGLARQSYGQNIERGKGSINENLEAYKEVWKGRIPNLNSANYNQPIHWEQNKKQSGGYILPKAQDGLITNPRQQYTPSSSDNVNLERVYNENIQKQEDLRRIQSLQEKNREKYEPTQAIKNAKAVAAIGQFSPEPLSNLGAKTVGTVWDLGTATKYALDGQYKNAGEDLIQAGVNWIPFLNQKKMLNLSKNTPSLAYQFNQAIPKINQGINYLQKGDNVKTTTEAFKNETGLGKKKNGGKLKKFQNAGLIKDPRQDSYYTPSSSDSKSKLELLINNQEIVYKGKDLPEVNITAPRAQYPTYRGQLSQNARDGDAANRARIAEERNINSYKGEQGLGNDLIGQGIGLLLMPELRAAESATALTKIGTEAFNAVNPFSGFGGFKGVKSNIPTSLNELKNTGFKTDPNFHRDLFHNKKQQLFEHLNTTEGRKRLQGYIDNNQHLQDLNKSVDDIITDFQNTTFQTERPRWDALIKNEEGNYQGGWERNPDGTEKLYPVDPDNAYNWYLNGFKKPSFVSMGQNYTPYDAHHILEHEFGHLFQRGTEIKGVDDVLSGIKLKGNYETSSFLDKIKEFNPFKKTVNDIGYSTTNEIYGTGINQSNRASSLKDQADYWTSGAGRGQEKAAFASEVRENLLQRGLLKDRYDEITPELLQEHHKLYQNTGGNKYNLRLYDIMNKNKNNYSFLSQALNKMPAILPYVGAGYLGYEGLQKQENEPYKYGGKVSQWEVMEEGGDVTQKGYKRNSPYVNNKQNIINSGRITMKGVDFPVHGVDEYGNEQMMFPNGEYSFPGNQVIETRMKQNGGCLECEQKSLIKAQNGITHDKGRYNLYLDSLAAFNEGERLYEEDENYNPGRHSPKDDKYFNDVQRGLTHGFRGVQKSGTVDPSVMNKTHLTLPEWTNPTPISYRPLQTPIQFSPNQEEIKIEKVPNAPMPKWDGHKDYFTIIGDKSGAMYNQKTGRKLEYGGLLKAQKGVRTPKQQKIHLGQSMQSASFQYGGDTDMYGNDMLANIVFKDSPRSVYNPKLNQIEFGNDYDNADNEQENYMIAHENFHAKQYAEGKSRFEPNRNDLIVPPSMVASDENWNGYHDRKDIESNIDIDNFINDNPSFQFVPRPLIYNKEVDGAQYENPYSLEGEAQYYENSGEVPDSYKNGGSIWEVIEDVKKPLKRFQKGGKTATVSELWEQKTGTPWAEAKKQGLTDGTLNPNLKLRESLLKGIIPTKQKQLPVQQEQPNQFTNINTIQQIPDVLFENPDTEKQFIQVPPNTINPDTVYHSRLVERMDDPTAGFTVTLQDSNPDLMTPSIPGLKSKDEWGNYPLHIDAKGQVPKMKLSTTTGNPNIFKNEGSSCRDSDGKVIHECASGAQRALDLNTKVNRRDLGITGDGWSMTQNIIDKGGKRVYGFQNLGNSDISQFKNTNHTKGILDNSDIKKFLDDKRKEMNISDKDIVSNAQKGDFVEMWYKNSPNQDKALKESKGNVITTHIGMITEDEKGKKYVTHNVDGTWHTDPLDKALSSHKLKMKGDHRIMVAGLVRPDYFDNTNALETTGVQVDPNGKTYTSESPRTPITNANGWKIHSEKDGEQAGKYPLLKESMEFTKGLSYYAPEVQKDFGLSDKETEQLMKLSFGLFGKESGFGVTNIYKDKERKRNIYNAYKEAVPEWAPESDELSSGKGQIKLNTVFDTPEKKALLKKYGITKENIWDSQNSAAALLLSTAMNYKNFKRFSGVDFENADPITVQNVLALAHNKGLNNVLKNEFTSRDVRTPQEKIKGFFTGEKNNNRKYDVEPYADLNTKLKGLETYSNLHTDKSSYANLVADYSASLNVDYNKVKQLANTAGSYEPRQDQLPQTISEYVGENINKGVNFVVNPIIKTEEKISGKVKRVGSNVHKIDDKAEKIIGRVEKKGATFLKKLRKHQNGGVIGDWEIIN